MKILFVKPHKVTLAGRIHSFSPGVTYTVSADIAADAARARATLDPDALALIAAEEDNTEKALSSMTKSDLTDALKEARSSLDAAHGVITRLQANRPADPDVADIQDALGAAHSEIMILREDNDTLTTDIADLIAAFDDPSVTSLGDITAAVPDLKRAVEIAAESGAKPASDPSTSTD